MEHLMAERLESNEERLEMAEVKYQWAIAGLKLMSVQQKLLVLEAMEQQMSSEEWRQFQEERYMSILEEIMDQRRVAEHQREDLETMVQVQAEKEVKARPVEEKPTVGPPLIQEDAKHLVAEKLEYKEELREVSEEEMKEVSVDKMSTES